MTVSPTIEQFETHIENLSNEMESICKKYLSINDPLFVISLFFCATEELLERGFSVEEILDYSSNGIEAKIKDYEMTRKQ